MKQLFAVEVTDTYAGEANYCWVQRFKVKASSLRGAMVKVGREMGLSFRKEYDIDFGARYKAKHACICAFIDSFDEEAMQHYTLKEL